MGATMARRIASAGSLLALAAGALLIPASTASAAERNGVCDAGEVCFYYNTNGHGSISDFNGSIMAAVSPTAMISEVLAMGRESV